MTLEFAVVEELFLAAVDGANEHALPMCHLMFPVGGQIRECLEAVFYLASVRFLCVAVGRFVIAFGARKIFKHLNDLIRLWTKESWLTVDRCKRVYKLVRQRERLK